MKKEQKEEVKKILSIIEDAKLLKFAKSFALKDEAFAKAVRDDLIRQYPRKSALHIALQSVDL